MFCFEITVPHRKVKQHLSPLRLLFGADEVRSMFEKANIFLDVWFTGGDFAMAALDQINAAVRRRNLCFVLEKVPVLIV